MLQKRGLLFLVSVGRLVRLNGGHNDWFVQWHFVDNEQFACFFRSDQEVDVSIDLGWRLLKSDLAFLLSRLVNDLGFGMQWLR